MYMLLYTPIVRSYTTSCPLSTKIRQDLEGCKCNSTYYIQDREPLHMRYKHTILYIVKSTTSILKSTVVEEPVFYILYICKYVDVHFDYWYMVIYILYAIHLI